MEQMVKCTRCRKTKPSTDFYGVKPDVVLKTCKKCRVTDPKHHIRIRALRAKNTAAGIKTDKRTARDRAAYFVAYRAKKKAEALQPVEPV